MSDKIKTGSKGEQLAAEFLSGKGFEIIERNYRHGHAEIDMIVRRDDGSWLLDGSLDLETVIRTLDAESLASHDDRQHYHTLGGLAMLGLGRVPRTGDVFERWGWRFEVVDMDGNRVDRILVSRIEGRGRPGAGSIPPRSG